MATKQKTWKQLHTELGESMRKWGISTWEITPQLTGGLPRRPSIDPNERAVTLTFRLWWDGSDMGSGTRAVKLTMRAGLRPIDNLEALVKAVEHLRLAEYRGITKLLVFAYRQLDPATPQQAPPPPPPPPRVPPQARPAIPEHYKRLGVLPDAPLEVAEAAYKALARRAHPDAGGSTIDMQQLNAAIERIRKEKARR